LFAAVGALAAQLTETAGGARAIALGTLALVYVVRAAGDAADAVSWLAWFSPLGWIQRAAAFGGERWWLLGVASLLAVGVAAVAVAVAARRDVGGGVIRPRTGPAAAAPSLRSPLALAWRLHRGMLAGWTAAFVVLGALYGSVAEAVGDMLRDNPDMQEIFARLAGGADTIIDLYLAGVAGVLGLIASGYAIQAALRMRVEEEGQRLEPVLATAVPRSRWLGVQVLFAFGGPAVVLVIGGLALGLAYGAVSGQVTAQVPRLVASTLVMLGAVWLLAGLAVAVFGVWPRLAPAIWGVFGAMVFISFFGAILDLGQWFLDLSPFTHIPALPGADFTVLPIAVLGIMAVALLAVGVRGFGRRDLG
jgi:ABC-2 type transport system permease protein